MRLTALRPAMPRSVWLVWTHRPKKHAWENDVAAPTLIGIWNDYGQIPTMYTNEYGGYWIEEHNVRDAS